MENTNNTQNLLQQIQEKQTDRMRQLASGNRIDRASDDAAAMQIIERLTSESEAYQRSLGNAFDGVSLLQVAEGGMQNISADLDRIRELTIQAGSGALSDSDRRALQSEVDQLRSNIDQTIERTEFAGSPLLSNNETREFLIGSSAGQNINVELPNVRERSLGGLDNLDLTNPDSRANMLSELDNMRDSINEQRAEFGAQQNVFQSAARELANTNVNMQESRSRLRDLDFAMATSENIQGQIRQNAAITVQGQANAQQSQVLSLLS
ncbi:MAG: flagellin [Idiomarina sp.]|nr:flagellin [Idiomarina sp.]